MTATEAPEMVSVIIPSFDRFDRLMACVESVMRASPRPPGGVQAVVVTSTYDSAQLDQLEMKSVSIVRLSNRSFVSESRNAGAAVAHGDYLLFVDDDNVLGGDAIWRLWQALQQWRDAVLVGPVMYYGSAPTRVWCAGVVRSPLLMKTSLVTQLPVPLPERLPSEDFPNCFMVRREDFNRVGGFDVRHFPQHMEEGDLARRLVRVTGQQVFCVPQAQVWHFIDATFLRRLHVPDRERAYWAARSRAVFVATYGSGLQWLAFLVAGQWALAALYLGAILSQSSHGRRALSVAYLRGMISGLRLGVVARGAARI